MRSDIVDFSFYKAYLEAKQRFDATVVSDGTASASDVAAASHSGGGSSKRSSGAEATDEMSHEYRVDYYLNEMEFVQSIQESGFNFSSLVLPPDSSAADFVDKTLAIQDGDGNVVNLVYALLSRGALQANSQYLSDYCHLSDATQRGETKTSNETCLHWEASCNLYLHIAGLYDVLVKNDEKINGYKRSQKELLKKLARKYSEDNQSEQSKSQTPIIVKELVKSCAKIETCRNKMVSLQEQIKSLLGHFEKTKTAPARIIWQGDNFADRGVRCGDDLSARLYEILDRNELHSVEVASDHTEHLLALSYSSPLQYSDLENFNFNLHDFNWEHSRGEGHEIIAENTQRQSMESIKYLQSNVLDCFFGRFLCGFGKDYNAIFNLYRVSSNLISRLKIKKEKLEQAGFAVDLIQHDIALCETVIACKGDFSKLDLAQLKIMFNRQAAVSNLELEQKKKKFRDTVGAKIRLLEYSITAYDQIVIHTHAPIPERTIALLGRYLCADSDEYRAYILQQPSETDSGEMKMGRLSLRVQATAKLIERINVEYRKKLCEPDWLRLTMQKRKAIQVAKMEWYEKKYQPDSGNQTSFHPDQWSISDIEQPEWQDLQHTDEEMLLLLLHMVKYNRHIKPDEKMESYFNVTGHLGDDYFPVGPARVSGHYSPWDLSQNYALKTLDPRKSSYNVLVLDSFFAKPSMRRRLMKSFKSRGLKTYLEKYIENISSKPVAEGGVQQRINDEKKGKVLYSAFTQQTKLFDHLALDLSLDVSNDVQLIQRYEAEFTFHKTMTDGAQSGVSIEEIIKPKVMVAELFSYRGMDVKDQKGQLFKAIEASDGSKAGVIEQFEKFGRKSVKNWAQVTTEQKSLLEQVLDSNRKLFRQTYCRQYKAKYSEHSRWEQPIHRAFCLMTKAACDEFMAHADNPVFTDENCIKAMLSHRDPNEQAKFNAEIIKNVNAISSTTLNDVQLVAAVVKAVKAEGRKSAKQWVKDDFVRQNVIIKNPNSIRSELAKLCPELANKLSNSSTEQSQVDRSSSSSDAMQPSLDKAKGKASWSSGLSRKLADSQSLVYSMFDFRPNLLCCYSDQVYKQKELLSEIHKNLMAVQGYTAENRRSNSSLNTAENKEQKNSLGAAAQSENIEGEGNEATSVPCQINQVQFVDAVLKAVKSKGRKSAKNWLKDDDIRQNIINANPDLIINAVQKLNADFNLMIPEGNIPFAAVSQTVSLYDPDTRHVCERKTPGL